MKYLCIGILLSGLIYYVQCQDPEITENILPEIRPVGVSGRLVCVVINQMDNPAYWIQKDTQMTISTNDKISVDPAQNPIINGWPKYQVFKEIMGEKIQYTLVVNRLEPKDKGFYTCQIMVRGSNRSPSKDGEMVVLIPPAVIQGTTTHTISAKEGSDVNMTCQATGYPSPNITWVRVSGSVLPGGMLRFLGTYLPLYNLSVEHRGIYRCLADNNVKPPAVHDATLLVFFKPVAAAIQSSYGQAENRMFDVTIECRIAGWPEPDLNWYKVLSGGNLEKIQNDDKHTINILLNHANILGANERWLQLVIRSVQANDYGDYECEGVNEMGSGSGRVNLFATSECQGPNCPPESQPEGAATATLSFVLFVVGLAINMAL